MSEMTHSSVGQTFQLPVNYEQALEQVTAALKAEGFGILTEIDVQATMRQKLNVEVTPYKILGACNPPLSHRALQADPLVGMLLPCNVTVREVEGGVEVGILDPNILTQHSSHPEVAAVASEAKARLERVVQALRAG